MFVSKRIQPGAPGATFDAQAVRSALERSMAVIEFTTDGVIKYANQNFCDALGYELDEIRGKHHSMFVTPEDRGTAQYAAFWAAVARGEHFTGRFKRITKAGKEIWIEASYNPVSGSDGRPIGAIKLAADVTDATIEAALLQGQVEAIGRSNAVIRFDMDGTIRYANANFLNAMGYSFDEIEGQHHSIFVASEERKSKEYAQFWNELRAGQFVSGEFRRIHKNGSDVWIQASYNPIFDETGAPLGVVKFATDVTGAVLRREETRKVGALVESNLAKIVSAVTAANDRAVSASADAGRTSEVVRSVAAAAEQFRASASDIAETMNRSTTEAARVRSATEAANVSTESLSTAADAMSNIVELIEGIAGKINLLALNATIEAARAGDAGKGFAVVASEVKSLAHQVEKATCEIGREIAGTQAATEEVVGALKNIGQAVRTVNESITSVAGAVDEQTAISGEIATNTQSASDATSSVDDALENISRAISECKDLAETGLEHYKRLAANAST